MALRLALFGFACSKLKSDFAALVARMSLIWPAASWRPTICLHKALVVDAGRVAAMQLQMEEKRRGEEAHLTHTENRSVAHYIR
jgi:hypothetical protein